MGVCGGPVGPRGAKSLCLTLSDRAFRENNQVCLKYHFQIPIPIPPEHNQKKVKYRYGTGKCRTLPRGQTLSDVALIVVSSRVSCDHVRSLELGRGADRDNF